MEEPGCPRRRCHNAKERAVKEDRDEELETERQLKRSLELLHLMSGIPVRKSLTKKPKVSNSIETKLSAVS